MLERVKTLYGVYVQFGTGLSYRVLERNNLTPNPSAVHGEGKMWGVVVLAMMTLAQ